MDRKAIFGSTVATTRAAKFANACGWRKERGEDKREAVISHRTRGGPPGGERY